MFLLSCSRLKERFCCRVLLLGIASFFFERHQPSPYYFQTSQLADQVHKDVPLTFELLAISMNGVLVDILTYSLCLLEVWCVSKMLVRPPREDVRPLSGQRIFDEPR